MLVILYIGICVGAALAYVAAKEKELHRRERALLDRELALGLGAPPALVVGVPPPAAGRELEGVAELVREELRKIVGEMPAATVEKIR